MIVEHLTYDTLDDRYDSAIFTENQTAQDFSKAGDKLKKHIYDYVVTDSKVERDFRHRAGHQRRGCRLRQAAARLLHPDPGRRLQPRLGDRVQGGSGQARLLRRRDQGLAVVAAAQGSGEGQDRVRPQVLRVAQREATARTSSTTSSPTTRP